jgi:fructose-1-phosphate kinase PfkB-like protein
VNVAVDTTALGAARPALVKVNAHEASTLTGAAVHSLVDAVEAAQELRRRAGGQGHAAAVTRGREGAVLVEPGGSAWHGTLEAEGRYSVGSGDSFLAGLVTALAAGGDWRQALATALGAAAANAEVPGAGLLDGERARALTARAVIQEAEVKAS